MSEHVRLQLFPLGKTLSLAPGTRLHDVLFAEGVEFPCGGRGKCKGCRIKLLGGELPVTTEDLRLLSSSEIEQGWRLSCRAVIQSDLKIELAQWEAEILADESPLAFNPVDGFGVAIDLGTTTIVAQLLDLQTGHVLSVRSGLNAQARHGADIMSRIEYSLSGPGDAALTGIVREQIRHILSELLAECKVSPSRVRSVDLVGNTVMHHLFCGIDLRPLSHYPFEPLRAGLEIFKPTELGWTEPPLDQSAATIRFLPCLGGFVGSDILAGILATRLHEQETPTMLVDLGTNGEIVLGDRHRLLCASTAAGPAFEGARISMGMRAATGAISEVFLREGRIECGVLGGATPRGICGSGLVDAIAVGLELGHIGPTGKLARPLSLAAPVEISQADVRELQLAKGAIAAGIRILAQRWGICMAEISSVHLAGAFGNYINRASARRIGLLPFDLERIKPAGNTALLGAKLSLFHPNSGTAPWSAVLPRVEHLALNEDPQFQDIFAEEMLFPSGSS